MLSYQRLVLIGLLAGLAVQARPVAQGQEPDWAEAGGQGGELSQGSFTRTGGSGNSYGAGLWGNFNRQRPSGAQPGGADCTGRPGGAGAGGGYGGGSDEDGLGGQGPGGESGGRPSSPEATGVPSPESQPSDLGTGSVILPSDTGAQPTPGTPDGPISSGMAPTATISEAPTETFPVVSDDLAETTGSGMTSAIPVATPAVTDEATPTPTDAEPPAESPTASGDAAGIIPIESGSAPSPIVTIPVEGSEPAAGTTDVAESDIAADPTATPTATLMGNMAFRPEGIWNRPAITRSYNLLPAESASAMTPVVDPAAPESMQTMVDPSTEWDTNPGSGPIIDQDEPIPVETPQATASAGPTDPNANVPA